MNKKQSLFLFILLFFIHSAFAYQNECMTGKKLLEYCRVALDIYDNNFGWIQKETEYTQGVKSGKCLGYVMGVKELYHLPMIYNKFAEISFIVNYLENHPGQLNWPASVLVLNAFEVYCPCGKYENKTRTQTACS